MKRPLTVKWRSRLTRESPKDWPAAASLGVRRCLRHTLNYRFCYLLMPPIAPKNPHSVWTKVGRRHFAALSDFVFILPMLKEDWLSFPANLHNSCLKRANKTCCFSGTKERRNVQWHFSGNWVDNGCSRMTDTAFLVPHTFPSCLNLAPVFTHIATWPCSSVGDSLVPCY